VIRRGDANRVNVVTGEHIAEINVCLALRTCGPGIASRLQWIASRHNWPPTPPIPPPRPAPPIFPTVTRSLAGDVPGAPRAVEVITYGAATESPAL